MNLSVKNVPDHLMEKLKARAARNRRSLQGEVLTILEESVAEHQRGKSPMEILEEIRKLGFSTASDSVQMIREDRDR